MLHVAVLIFGLAVLIAGGELLVRGAAALAGRLGVAPVVVGLTVVAFGTSTPELVVNLAAVLRGDSAIGFGNVVGSNIANIGLLLATTALVHPLVVHRSIVAREIPMMLLASLAVVVLGLNSLIDGGADRFTRGDGLMLVLLFGVFLYYTIGDALQQRDAFSSRPHSSVTTSGAASGRWVGMLVVTGLLLLAAGGELTVRGAVGFAQSVGISDVTIGLTLVALGTSLPELASTMIAARRGETDMAVGTLVGSNVFNLLFIWGVTVALVPTDLPVGGRIDLLVMTAFAAALLPMALTQHRLSRLEGGLLVTSYVAYILWLAMQ